MDTNIGKVRVYLDVEHLDFYLSAGRGKHRRDVSYGAYDSEDELAEAVERLLKEGHDLLPCAGQRELGSRYVPARLLEWPRAAGGSGSHMLYAKSTLEEIERLLWAAAHENLLKTYGAEPVARRRLDEEWREVKRNGNLPDVAVLHELAAWMKREGRPHWLPGSAGASFLLYLLGVTRGDPLLPCRAMDGLGEGGGHGIPWRVLWPDGRPSWFEVRLPASARDEVLDWLRGHWLFALYPELPLAYPAPGRIHFSHIQLNFTPGAAEPRQGQAVTEEPDRRDGRRYLRYQSHIKEYRLFEAECGGS